MLKLFKSAAKAILLLTGILPLLKCSSAYRDKNGKVTFNGKEITDKSFVVLNDVFAKDSSVAYYKEKAITSADVASFAAVDEHYARDNNQVYYCTEHRDGQTYYTTKKQEIYTLDNALPASFKSIGNGYAKDSLHAYFDGFTFPVKDLSTLASIDRNFAKDAVHAYFNMHTVAGSDGKTFEVLQRNYARDTAQVYFFDYNGEVIDGIYTVPCNRATFEVLDYPYSKDTTAVFYKAQKIGNADAATFTVLQDGYAKDAHAVYYQNKKLEGADAATFTPFKDNELYADAWYYARDKEAVYCLDKKLAGAVVDAFKVLGGGYGCDNKTVYYNTHTVKGANAKSFKVYVHVVGNADAEDAANKYNEGILVKD